MRLGSQNTIDVNSIVGISKLMEGNELLLMYRDAIDQTATENLLAIAEVKMNIGGNKKKLKRKLFNILIECLQNVVKHSDALHIEEYRKASLFILGRKAETYFVVCGNVIESEKVAALKKKIDDVNKLSEKELKDQYGKIIVENELSEKGGAGLGLIEMCRKSGHKMEYAFKLIDKEFSYFTLKLKIDE